MGYPILGFAIDDPYQWTDFVARHPGQKSRFAKKPILDLPYQRNDGRNTKLFVTGVNFFVNQIRYERERDDHWDIFTSLSAKGDCENFTFTKRQMLANVYPLVNLPPIVCEAPDGEGHMILGLYADNALWLMDNYNRPGVKRWPDTPHKLKYMLYKNTWVSVL